MTDYERFGDYQPSERGHVGTALTFLFIGLGVGSLLALLFAPKTGRQMRKSLRRRYEDAMDMADDLRERGGEWAETARERVAPIAKSFKR